MRRLAIIPVLLGAAMVPASGQQLMWQGEVTGPTQLIVRGDRVEVSGYGRVDRMDYRFYEPLPQERATVGVTVRQGRGTVRVLEQPRRNNEFTTVVSVDPQGRRQFMVLDFTWDARGRNNNGSVLGNNNGYGSRNRSANVQSGSVTWSGRVDQEAVIEIRGRRVAERTLRGQPVYTNNANFSSPLPRADVNVQLTDARGRGRIEVVEQPSSMNNYTARVRIYDQQTGSGDYSFVLSWGDQYGSGGGVFPGGGTGDYTSGNGTEPGIFDNSGGYTAGDYSGTGNRLMWSGRVDGRIRVIVQGNRSWVETLSGQPPRDVRISFGAPMPARSMNVDLDRARGRDEVRLIEAPSPSNGYRAVFEIDDASAGYDYYEVELKW